jgi:predicted N-formylglutamate amidohydrolase
VPCTIPTHAAAHGLPHVTIEMRQDLIDTHKGAEAWAKRLAAVLSEVLAAPGLHRPFESWR